MRSFYYILVFIAARLVLADEIEFLDYNFDGHEDRRIWRESTGKLGYYDIYLYCEETKSFEKHSALSDLYNPIPNRETREIECYWSGGHAGMIHRIQIYAWEGDGLKHRKTITQDHMKVGKTWEYIRVTVVVADGVPRIELIEHVEPTIK